METPHTVRVNHEFYYLYLKQYNTSQIFAHVLPPSLFSTACDIMEAAILSGLLPHAVRAKPWHHSLVQPARRRWRLWFKFERKIDLMPGLPLSFLLARPVACGALFQFDTVRDIKEKLCYIPTAHGAPPGEDEYELPDGSTVTLDSDCRSQAAEVT